VPSQHMVALKRKGMCIKVAQLLVSVPRAVPSLTGMPSGHVFLRSVYVVGC
jgi:hypothetical protein